VKQVSAHLQTAPSDCDVLVVGGGINGAAIARDLAGRQMKVVLCEKDDLASHTSSSSTKLIHGGLRYLEHYEFGLVRKALAEREVLLRSAPHIIWPLRFVMPHHPGMRPAWLLRAGLFLYDHLAKRELLPGSCAIDLHGHMAGAPLQRRFRKAYIYADAWVDDARLVLLNAVDAAQRGAVVLTRTACVDAQRGATHWHVTLQSQGGRTHHVRSRALVNATGPWAAEFLQRQAHVACPSGLRLVKGSHIVAPRLFAHDHAYLFQNSDGRILFAIPYESDFTLIGTTDVEFSGRIGSACIEDSEVSYLCQQANAYFERQLTPADVVWSYSGVRPLVDDESGHAAAVTRDYRLELNTQQATLLNVWGGKITTFRKLAEQAAQKLTAVLAMQSSDWTATAKLPGGDFSAWVADLQRPDLDFERLVQALKARYPQVDAVLMRRWARAYGACVDRLVGHGELGAEVAPGLFEAELRYLHDHEWARCADDVLWRRSKLGLHLSSAQREQVAKWCTAHWPGLPSTAEAERRSANRVQEDASQIVC
jgi:glycerol-3-phosphate dehydrogenase